MYLSPMDRLKNRICFAPENDGGTSNPAPASTETFENTQTADTSSVLDVLHFDPFKKGDEIPDVKSPQVKDNAKPSGVSNEKPSPAPAPAPAPGTKEATSTTPSGDDQAKHWRDVAEHYKAIAEGTKPKAGSDTEVDNKDKAPNYQFDVPDKLIDVLAESTDKAQFKQGIIALIQGMAGAVHVQMMNSIKETYEPRFASIPQMLQTHLVAQQQNKAISDDFYGTYPELNQPQLKAFVRQTGEAVAKELNKTGWDAELRDAVAKRVKEIMTVVSTAQQTPNRTPPRMLGTQGTRPSAPANDEATDISDTIFGNF